MPPPPLPPACKSLSSLAAPVAGVSIKSTSWKKSKAFFDVLGKAVSTRTTAKGVVEVVHFAQSAAPAFTPVRDAQAADLDDKARVASKHAAVATKQGAEPPKQWANGAMWRPWRWH